MKNYWLVKSEPDSYSWDDLVAEGKTSWTGVRNFTARNNLRSMHVGDEVLFITALPTKRSSALPKSFASLIPIPPRRKAIGVQSIWRQSDDCATPSPWTRSKRSD